MAEELREPEARPEGGERLGFTSIPEFHVARAADIQDAVNQQQQVETGN